MKGTGKRAKICWEMETGATSEYLSEGVDFTPQAINTHGIFKWGTRRLCIFFSQ
jgi:hypothetical protein